jgi:hypothetical protein
MQFGYLYPDVFLYDFKNSNQKIIGASVSSPLFAITDTSKFPGLLLF